MSSITEHAEWRVETEDTEDEFGADEQAARKWLAECNAKAEQGEPHWLPAVLMRRVVTTTITDWRVSS